MTIATLCDQIRQRGKKFVSTCGSTLYDWHRSTDRYVVDFADDFTPDGWQQFDTSQDAYYFGVWVNPDKRLTLSYMEGDWRLVECPTDEAYNAEIRSMCECYGEGFICKAVDVETATVTEYRQDRSLFLKGGAR